MAAARIAFRYPRRILWGFSHLDIVFENHGKSGLMLLRLLMRGVGGVTTGPLLLVGKNLKFFSKSVQKVLDPIP